MTETHQHIKDTYNTLVGDTLAGAYEYDRWFKTSVLTQGYKMTKYAIQHHVLSLISAKTSSVLELGPGPGTWTKELLAQAPTAVYDLVDISKEMLAAAGKALHEYPDNIKYHEIDFLDFEPTKQYDVFFSSRAIEYITDKEKAVAHITQSLRVGGQGFIITKTPHYQRQKMLGKVISQMHQNQIEPHRLKELLLRYGCANVRVYPVVMSCYYSVFKSLTLNRVLHILFRNHVLNRVSKHFSESYLVSFTKQ